MSLLLDALKKAARDKQASSSDSAVLDRKAEDQAEPASEGGVAGNQQMEHPGAVHAGPDDTDSQYAHAGDAADTELTLELEQAATTTSTVSDEALQMLIYKTNREYRRKQKAIWSAVAAASMIVLLLGGYYFYHNMVEDIEALERKHRIAIQKVNAEEIKQKRPELIADLTSDETAGKQAEPVNSDAVSEQQAQQPKKARLSGKTEAAVANNKSAATPRSGKVSFSRSRQQDPVAGWLQNGWQAYNRADYAEAKKNYEQVLQREQNNRDALLGLAAIAIKQNRPERAASLYKRLIQLDPRDPVAVPALAGLKQTVHGGNDHQLGDMDESKLKVLLKQQPDSAPVNFALGNIYARQSRWPQAQSYYFNAWAAEENNPDYAYNLAVSLDHTGKPQQAKRFYRRSLELATGRNHGFSPETVRRRLQALEQQ